MATRHGRKGDYLLTDDYRGYTIFGSQARRDYWGNLTLKPLIRNLQEIASPLNDPEPVIDYRGPEYEQADPCEFESVPQYVGLTLVPTNLTGPYFQVFNGNPAIPDMIIDCTFVVQGPPNPVIQGTFLGTESGQVITTESGVFLEIV